MIPRDVVIALHVNGNYVEHEDTLEVCCKIGLLLLFLMLQLLHVTIICYTSCYEIEIYSNAGLPSRT